MPTINRLVISSFRNIEHAEFRPSPGLNLFYGLNGSGKTSVLEAIHLLAMGRSFRSHLQKPLIQDGKSEAYVFGATDRGGSIGIQRGKTAQVVQVDGKKVDSLAELPRQLPLQLINTDSTELLEGSPQERRRFLDWGVFHVERHFIDSWRRYRRALYNRNSLLKQHVPMDELAPWTAELARSGEQIHQYRQNYIELVQPHLGNCQNLLPGLVHHQALQMSYSRGWPNDIGLAAQLELDVARDRRYGHTCSGPHRADLSFKFRGYDAVEVLSRGQLKLFACALKLAQVHSLEAEVGHKSVLLVDDLAAELDEDNRFSICALLCALNTQVFLSAIESEAVMPALRACSSPDAALRLFHVKRGTVEQVDGV